MEINIPEEEIKEDERDDAEDQIEFEATVANCLSNLASTLDSLSDIDPLILSKSRQNKLARIKRKIFDAIDIYCDYLPIATVEKNEED